MANSNSHQGDDFSKLAETQTPSLIREFMDFMRNNKKWWMLPIVAVLLLFGALLVLSSSVAAPFIYTLF
jgi:hypothetical protein